MTADVGPNKCVSEPARFQLESNAFIRTIHGVFKPEKVLACVLLVAAGCASAPRRGRERAQDWDANESKSAGPLPTTHVAEPPPLAPPATGGPELPATPANQFPGNWIPLQRWSDENRAGSFHRISGGPTPAFELRTTNGAL